METQFKFRGVLQEEKPLRDWIQEVLMNCLGFYTFAFGKLKIGIRENSSAIEAFTVGNILFQSLQLAPIKPAFNHLTANFADEEFLFANNSVQVYDIDYAALIGGAASPLFLKSNMNLSGTSSKSQAARIISTRLREELGGITSDQWKSARLIGFKTTVLALNAEPGMVCSMTHDDMPESVLGALFSDNFDSYAEQAAFAAHWTLKGQGTLGVVPAWGSYGQGSTKGVLISQCGPLTGVFDKSVMWKTFGTNYATLAMGFRVFIPSTQPLSPTFKTTLAYFSINNGSYGADIGDGYAQFGVMLTADMKLAASNLWYGIPVGTETPLNFDMWYFVELKVTFDQTAGSFELRLNGTTVASATGVQTVGGDGGSGFYPNYANSVVLGSGEQNLSTGQPITPQYQLDDFYVAPSYLLKSSYGEFRVTGWKLNKDYSIDIQGRTTVDEMYDLVDGPKPADVPASPIPVELLSPQVPLDLTLLSKDNGDLFVTVKAKDSTDFPVSQYKGFELSVIVDLERQRTGATTALAASQLIGDLTLQLVSVAGLKVGDPINVGLEVETIVGPGNTGDMPGSTTVDVARAQALSVAAVHTLGDLVYLLTGISPFTYMFPPGYIDAQSLLTSGGVNYKLLQGVMQPGRMRILYGSVKLLSKNESSDPFEKSFAISPGSPYAEENVFGALPGSRIGVDADSRQSYRFADLGDSGKDGIPVCNKCRSFDSFPITSRNSSVGSRGGHRLRLIRSASGLAANRSSCMASTPRCSRRRAGNIRASPRNFIHWWRLHAPATE